MENELKIQDTVYRSNGEPIGNLHPTEHYEITTGMDAIPKNIISKNPVIKYNMSEFDIFELKDTLDFTYGIGNYLVLNIDGVGGSVQDTIDFAFAIKQAELEDKFVLININSKGGYVGGDNK